MKSKLETVGFPNRNAVIATSAIGALAALLFAVATPRTADAVQFGALTPLQTGLSAAAALAMGPENPDPLSDADGCLYVVNAGGGTVNRVCFDATKTVTSNTTVVTLNAGAGVNNVLGITVEAIPTTTSAVGDIVMYLGYSVDNSAPFQGRIARAISTDGGVTFTTNETFITGLSRSSFDHQTNGLDIGPDGCLYIAQGNSSNAGYDVDYAETRLASAILRACFRDPAVGPGAVDPLFDGNCGAGNTQEACDVEVYASGLRNPFDLVWHSNGRLYNADNDANDGFRDSCGGEANNFGCACQQLSVNPIGDELNLIEQGKYYGSPNPYLAMPTGLQCQGGTDGGDACTVDGDCAGGGTCVDLSALCTDGVCGDAVQCLYFGDGVAPPTPIEDPNGIYRAPMLQIAELLDGTDEYRGRHQSRATSQFCSDWNGDLLITGGPGSLRRFSLQSNGTAATHEGTTNLQGASGLDTVVGIDGTIYSADYSGARVTYISPVVQSNPLAADYFVTACAAGESCTAGACETDTDNDGMGDSADPCPTDALNACAGGVAIDGNTGNAIRINANTSGTQACAGNRLDCRGETWLADFGYNNPDSAFECNLAGGCVIDTTSVFGCTDATTEDIFKCEHWDAVTDAELQYSFDVPDGDYVVNLLFMNAFTGSELPGDRSFDIRIENATVYSGFDQVVAAGGSGIPVVRAAQVTVSDGNGLQIELGHVVENPAIKGIEVLAVSNCTVDLDCNDSNVCTDDVCNAGICEYTNNTASCDDGLSCTSPDVCGGGVCTSTDTCTGGEFCNPGTDMCEVPALFSRRINVNGPAHVGTDYPGTWEADVGVGGVCGPSEFAVTDPINGTVDDPLFSGEVYGAPVVCAIDDSGLPLAAAEYDVTLLFAEIFQGPGCQGSTGGAGSRVFDVTLEGTTVETGIDLWSENGCAADTIDPNTGPVVRNYTVTVTDGTLDITLPATADNGKISAIEIVQLQACVVNADCDDSNVCTDEICNAGLCEYTNNTASCDDGVSCTSGDICGGGVCDGADNCTGGTVCDPGLNMCVAPDLIDTSFDTCPDPDFGLIQNPWSFRGAGNTTYENGACVPSGGFDGTGGLDVTLGGIDSTTQADMQAGWQASFTLAQSEEVTLSFRYNLTMGENYEANEFAQVIASIDGVGIAGDGSDYIVQLTGDGNGGVPDTTGWVLFNLNLGTQSAGPHTVTIGTYNNAKTEVSEVTTLGIDDVLVEIVPSGGVCGDGVLDVGEACDNGAANGTSGQCCSAVCSFESIATECRASADVCDAAEMCDGASAVCPADDPAPVATLCRAAGDVCDVAEFCNGVDLFCPADGFEPVTTECRASAGTCDVAETCSGAGPSCPVDVLVPAASECRASADVCDVAEQCDGVAPTCPADGFESAATLCRGAAGACDVAELCTGAGPSCPGDILVPAATECRASADVCDVAEACTGASPLCPGDAFEPATTECRVSAGACDVAELCTGAGASCPGDAFEPATTECRASADVCDVAELCTGAGALCPADGFEPVTTECRAQAGACDVAETCSGAGVACPADGFEPATTECRASADVCDVAELCTGAGALCPADGFEPVTTECRAQAGACDVAETCSGAGVACPADGFEPATTECRASADVCDVAELCTGAGALCPADGFEPVTTECRAQAGACDVAETCSGAGVACPADGFEPATTECRASADVCDVAELCTGAGALCPADGFEPVTTECRAQAGACDVAETCSGAGVACPADGFEPATTECRAAADVCDVAESCSGAGALCPADGFEPVTTECRVSADVCDLPETCTGAGIACPADGFEPATTECRAAADICDLAETCTGAGIACPADGFEPATTECRAAADVCDLAETCTGAGIACPADGFEPATTECRAVADLCDVAELCSGAGVACPADGFLPAATSCRASAGACDVEDTCSGSAPDCPDVFVPAATECRASTDVCDSAEACTGADPACPADGFEPVTTVCRAQAGLCDVADTCTGAGPACPPDGYQSAGFTCRPKSGLCDVEDQCSGIAPNCPNGFEPATTQCRVKSGACDVADFCPGDAGNCPNGVEPEGIVCRTGSATCEGDEVCDGVAQTCPPLPNPPLDCSDGNLCTADGCDMITGCFNTPVPGCVTDVWAGTLKIVQVDDGNGVYTDAVEDVTGFNGDYAYSDTCGGTCSTVPSPPDGTDYVFSDGLGSITGLDIQTDGVQSNVLIEDEHVVSTAEAALLTALGYSITSGTIIDTYTVGSETTGSGLVFEVGYLYVSTDPFSDTSFTSAPPADPDFVIFEIDEGAGTVYHAFGVINLPEPGASLMLGSGILGLLALARRRGRGAGGRR